MIDSIDYDSIVKFINQEIIQNKLYVQAGGGENMVIGLKEIISDKIWIENTIQTISDGLQKLNPLMFMTAKNLISSNELPDPFVHGSLDNNKTYTKELIVLLLIGGYLLYTNQDNQELQFYVYLTISLLVGFYIIINKTTILDATESILFTANDFIRSIIPGLKSEFEIKLEKNVKIFEEINEPLKRLNNAINETYESAKGKKELTDQEKEIFEQFFSEKDSTQIEKGIDSLDKIKEYINNHKVDSYKEYNKIKPIIIFNCKKVLSLLKRFILFKLKLLYVDNIFIIEEYKECKETFDKYYKYIENFNWDEFSKKSYNFLTNPIKETNSFKEINQLTEIIKTLKNDKYQFHQKILDELDIFFNISKYFVLVIYNIDIDDLFKKFKTLVKSNLYQIYKYFSEKINENKTKLKLERKTSKNLDFFLTVDQTENLIKMYRKYIENNNKTNEPKMDLDKLQVFIDTVKNDKTVQVGGGFKPFFLEAPSNILQFITWIVSYPLDQVKQMFLTNGSSNVSYYFNASTGLIDLIGFTNKIVVLNSSSYFGKKGIVMEITGSKITYKINGEVTDSISYINAKPVHTALVLTYMTSNIKNKVQTSEKSDSKYLYSIENDKIRLFEKNSDGSQGNEIQSVQMAIRNELEGNYQAARDARNKVCEKLFGVNESNPLCAKHFYTILGKSGLGMLHNLAEPTKKDHIYSALINAEPNIKYEILKNLGWKMKVLRNDKQIVDVDEWLETLGQDLRSEYEKYFKNYSHVKIILNKMIQDLNNNTKILDQKYNQLVNTPKPLVRKKRLTSAQIAMLRKLKTSI